MSFLTPKQRAIDKTKLEISKDINDITNIAKMCGLGELLFFLHYLHFIRLIKKFGNVAQTEEQFTELIVRQVTEAYKYLIQLLYKHSQKRFINDKNGKVLNSDLTGFLTKAVLNINSKFETLSFLTLFENVEISGERDQFVKLNLDSVIENEILNKFFYYGFRADRENNNYKNDIKAKDDYLAHFRSEHMQYADLFEKEFKITLDNFVKLIDFILETVNNQIIANKDSYVYLENGNVEVQAYGTIMSFTKSLFIAKQEIIDKFGETSEAIIERLTFKSNEFDEKQLNYNLIARQPLLNFEDEFLVSPELLLDSLFVNTHYSLLETGNSKEEYKKRYSSIFVNKISQLANKYGYSEVQRELELFEGKKQIGDVDLVLKNLKNHYLLIEAKNHTIPMDVYFHDFEATQKRLEYLEVEWETKVDRRYKNLQINYSKYNLGPNFSYVIISKSPEILSHFSKYLVLSIKEFEYWLEQSDLTMTFQKLFDDLYNADEDLLTKEQLKKMQNDLNTLWRFEEK